MRAIGIIYMCTGNYKEFWKQFYESCEKYFITDFEKKYFVFTDADYVEYEDKNANIVRTFLKHENWPYITLFRNHTISKHQNLFEGIDYLYFFNANIEFLQPIYAQEFLPETDELVIIPMLERGKDNLDLYNEKNKKSKAYIADGEGEYYAIGALYGGRKDVYLNLVEFCKKNIQEDWNNNIIASWHDQSHLNRYILDNPKVKCLKKEIYLSQEMVSSPNHKIKLWDKSLFFKNGMLELRTTNKLLRLPIPKIGFAP